MRRPCTALLLMVRLLPAWASDADLHLNRRKIVALQASFKGETPAEPVEAAEAALATALQAASGPGRIEHRAVATETPAVMLPVNEVSAFYLQPGDLGGVGPGMVFDAVALDAARPRAPGCGRGARSP